MKDSIIVKVSELRSIIQDIRRSGCDLVALTINESDEYNGETLPPFISFSACKSFSPDEWVDFEEVEAVPNDDELYEKSFYATHISSNLL